MRIATDIDDTVLQCSDFLQAFLVSKGFVIPERLRDHHNIPQLFDLDIATTLELIREFHRSPAMGQLEPEPCAAIVLPELYRQGHRFVAITACLNEPEVVKMRIKNLEEVFGFEWDAVHCIGLKTDKSDTLRAYPPSIWVEDMAHHASTGARLGYKSFLLDRPYNRIETHSAVIRVHDWHEIADAINR